MAIIHVLMSVPTVTGAPAPARGSLRFTALRRHIVVGSPDNIVLPVPLQANLLEGKVDVTIATGDPTLVWKIDERVTGLASRTFHAIIPDVPEMDYTDLIAIDPLTLEPAADVPAPLWYAYVDSLAMEASVAKANAADSAAAAADSAVASAAAAAELIPTRNATAASAAAALASANAADTSEANALASAGNSSASASAALTSQLAAASSKAAANTSATTATSMATAASQYATSSASSATASAGSATAAAASATTALGAKTAAETARDAAAAKAAEASVNATGFSVGTVTTVSPVTPASATITGVAPNRKLDLTLPKGDIGLTPAISIGTVTTGNAPQTTVGPQGNGGPQGIQGLAGDMVSVTGPATASGTITIATGDLPTTRLWTLGGNITITLPTPSSARSGTITLVMTQDATGGRTVTWPATLKWPDGIAQQPATAAGAVSIIHLLWAGSQWYGLLGGKSFA